jgi:hypothetical protein
VTKSEPDSADNNIDDAYSRIAPALPFKIMGKFSVSGILFNDPEIVTYSQSNSERVIMLFSDILQNGSSVTVDIGYVDLPLWARYSDEVISGLKATIDQQNDSANSIKSGL